jgi:hypothetical protein
MHDLGGFIFKITVHRHTEELDEIIKDIFNKFDWTPVTEYGINRYRTSNNFCFQINYPETFLKTFKNGYSNMLPHNSIPATAFNSCIQQTCPLLYQGKIHKCSTAGLLANTLEKFNNPNIEQWTKFIDHGLSPSNDINEIIAFINNFGKPNKICAQCPTSNDVESILDHKLTVEFK